MSNLLSTGQTIASRYRVEGFIGEGGMQEVYRAYDTSFDRIVALKIPKNLSAEKRFNLSAELSARIVHPHVAQTLDFVPESNTQYLIEEYIEGKNLQIVIDAYKLFDPHLAAHVIHHIAKGVAASHNAGVVHRDLKPSNIMVSDDPGILVVKITDFGIAKMAEAEIDEAVELGEDSITASSTAVGALPYMAPEVITNSKAGPPCDVWAIGAMLFYLMTGKAPFGKGLQAVPRIVSGNRSSLIELLSPKSQFLELVNELDEIIGACLKQDPSDRPTAQDLVDKFSKLCYSTATRYIGTIGSFKEGNGKWGYIFPDGGGKVFFNELSFYGVNIVVGSRVNYAPFPGIPNPRAHPVLPLGS